MAYTCNLIFSEKNYEYDIYALIRQFYPGMDIHILYEGIEAEEMTGETKTPVVPAETMQEKRKRQNDEEPEVQAVFSVRYEAESVRFFYEKLPAAEASIIEENAPAGEMLLPEEAYALSGPVTDWEDRIRTKNEVKAVVYKALTEMTGKQMPWGDLTGIRPTKIPMKVLDDGGSREEAEKLLKETYFVSEEKTQLALDTAVLEKSLLDTIETETGYSLYVGIPFCPSICLYCSFGSHRLEQWKKMVDPYLQTMYKELRFIADEMQDRHLDTIYIGGGTPTSITAEQLDELLGVLDDTFPLRELREFTVEAGRPDTITEDKLRVLRKYPVTRISINPQTMNQKTLDLIGRGHTVEETIEKFRLARKLGFDNINMDLIVGLPGEGEEEVLHTLEEVRKLDPDSLTVHSLALKRATRLNLFKDQYRPVSFENSARIMDKTMECARAMGMNPYYLYRQKNMAGNFENVGYARPGKEGLYNILIMEEKQSILAAGSGASTKFVFDGGKRIERAENVKDLRNYIDRIDEMLERKKKGIDLYLKPQGGCSAG